MGSEAIRVECGKDSKHTALLSNRIYEFTG